MAGAGGRPSRPDRPLVEEDVAVGLGAVGSSWGPALQELGARELGSQ